jgi:hypothetical protein
VNGTAQKIPSSLLVKKKVVNMKNEKINIFVKYQNRGLNPQKYVSESLMRLYIILNLGLLPNDLISGAFTKFKNIEFGFVSTPLARYV